MPRATAKSKSSDAGVSSDQRRRAGTIVRRLAKTYPDAECALVHRNPYELVAATILSAQCTDERVNLTTPALFKKYPTPEKLARAKQADVEKLVQSCGFFRSKAKSLLGMARGLVENHDGKVPQDLDSLVKLPGVGRKTANVVLGVAFGIPSGVVVDTHVKRISNLLGLTRSKNPEIIERDLMAVLPKKHWIDYSHRLIHHGRQICKARKPACTDCPLLSVCPRVGLDPLE
ncbi:endonuclease III [Stratiformator vulcanicus]|uniref:Endonuclease III n=1 Tax=Stratiformator vulcanicus TaxID=2527980 RepID=A0A517R0R7_9PLAN|nr:endonuclease III [Stratiformator vulcanicus]QDT37497.1 Ultraviolet N-glycosylase/AP lyase [Stratiformator vulcanicus]